MIKKSLPVLNDDKTKCFDAHSRYEVACQKLSCKHHMNDESNQNCVIIAAQKGPHTLQNIGKIYGLTRMRICQIEKNILQKLKNSIVI
jgi:hypothetical protein